MYRRRDAEEAQVLSDHFSRFDRDLLVFRFPVSGFRFPVSGFWFQVLGFRFPVSGFRIQDSGFGIRVKG